MQADRDLERLERMTGRTRRVIWAYDLEHLLHPFIGLGLSTLVEAGWDVTMVSEDKAEGAPYRSFDDFSYARRERHYHELIVLARGRLEQAAIGHEHSCQTLLGELEAGPGVARRLELSGAADADLFDILACGTAVHGEAASDQ